VQNLLSSSLLSKNLKIKIYRTIILQAVLYGYETWSLILREDCRLRVFENRMLRIIFGPKRDDVTGEWKKYIMKSLMIYSSPNIFGEIKSRIMRWAGHVALWRRLEVHIGFSWKPEAKRPLGRPRRRWQDNIKMDVQEVGCEDTDWIDLAQDRDRLRVLMKAVMYLRVP